MKVVQLCGVYDGRLVGVALHEEVIRGCGAHWSTMFPQTRRIQGIAAVGATILPTAADSNTTDGWYLQIRKLVAPKTFGIINEIRIVATVSGGSTGRDETGGSGQDTSVVVIALRRVRKIC